MPILNQTQMATLVGFLYYEILRSTLNLFPTLLKKPHAHIEVNSSSFTFSAIYYKPYIDAKIKLWNNLLNFSLSIHEHWLLVSGLKL